MTQPETATITATDANADAEITKDEFIRRFTAEAIRLSGFTHFADGIAVAEYCEDVVERYWGDPRYREDSPEECAASDVSYWGEE